MGPIRELGPADLLRVRAEDLRQISDKVRIHAFIHMHAHMCIHIS